MLRPTTMVDMAWEPTAAMDSVPMATDTVPMATDTPPTPDMDTTTARGPLMLRLSPRLILRPTTMVDMAWEPTAAMDSVPMATDTVLMATDTPPTPDMDTTTARDPLMLRLSPRLMLRP